MKKRCFAIKALIGVIATSVVLSLGYLTIRDMYSEVSPNTMEVEAGTYNLTASDLGTTANGGDAVPASLSSFSYEEDYMLYYGDFSIKTSDFLNTHVCPVDDQESAVEQAKNECTIEYNATSEYYDRETEMWRVDFQTISREQEFVILVGTRQSVYLDSNGITHLIVYHED